MIRIASCSTRLYYGRDNHFMIHRFISVLAILALSITYLPGIVGDIFPSKSPACCDGIMCPMMHRQSGGEITCDMQLAPNGGQLEACPEKSQHFATLVFVRVASRVVFVERMVDTAPVLAPAVVVSIGAEVDLPPPRHLTA